MKPIEFYIQNYEFDPFVAVSVFAAFFVFFYRVHSTNQIRMAKSIADAVLKINDLCVDAFYKNDPQLRLKALMLLSFLEMQLTGFPYAGAMSRFIPYRSNNIRTEIDVLFRAYEDCITYNTPIENKSLEFSEEDKERQIDKITNAGINLVKALDQQIAIII